MAATLVNKISTGAIGLKQSDLQKLALNAGENVKIDVARVFGVATSMERNKGKFTKANGDPSIDTKFLGRFMATNLLTGEEFESGVAYIPGPAEKILLGALSKSEGQVEVEFAFTLTVHANGKPTVYEYGAVSAVEVKAEDPLSKLKSLFPARADPKQIEPPSKKSK